jgi:hypothetical protein
MNESRSISVQVGATVASAAIALSVLAATAAFAQNLTLGSKPLPSAKDVADMLEQPQAKVFEKFGAPSDLTVKGPKSKSPGVYVDYNKFAFVIVDKVVTECQFGSDWPGPVFGATVRDNSEAIVKAMGKPNEDIKNANGTEMMVWNRKDNKSKISITFDKEHKSDGLFLELK